MLCNDKCTRHVYNDDDCITSRGCFYLSSDSSNIGCRDRHFMHRCSGQWCSSALDHSGHGAVGLGGQGQDACRQDSMRGCYDTEGERSRLLLSMMTPFRM